MQPCSWTGNPHHHLQTLMVFCDLWYSVILELYNASRLNHFRIHIDNCILNIQKFNIVIGELATFKHCLWSYFIFSSSRCRRQSSWGWPQLSLSFGNNFSNYVNWRIDHELDYEQGGKIGTEGLKWLDLLVDFSCFLILNWLFLPVKLCKQIWILHDCKDTPILEYLVLIFFSIYHTFHCQPHQIPHRHPLENILPTPQHLSPTFFFPKIFLLLFSFLIS